MEDILQLRQYIIRLISEAEEPQPDASSPEDTQEEPDVVQLTPAAQPKPSGESKDELLTQLKMLIPIIGDMKSIIQSSDYTPAIIKLISDMIAYISLTIPKEIPAQIPKEIP